MSSSSEHQFLSPASAFYNFLEQEENNIDTGSIDSDIDRFLSIETLRKDGETQTTPFKDHSLEKNIENSIVSTTMTKTERTTQDKEINETVTREIFIETLSSPQATTEPPITQAQAQTEAEIGIGETLQFQRQRIQYDVVSINSSIQITDYIDSITPLPTIQTCSSSSDTSPQSSPILVPVRLIPSNSAYYLNGTKVDTSSSSTSQQKVRIFEIYVRPDVSEDKLLCLTEQVLLSIGGAVSKESYTPPSTTMLKVTMPPDRASSVGWSVIQAMLGVNDSKHRVMLMSVTTEFSLISLPLRMQLPGALLNGDGGLTSNTNDKNIGNGNGNEGLGSSSSISSGISSRNDSDDAVGNIFALVQSLAEAMFDENYATSSLLKTSSTSPSSSSTTTLTLESIIDPAFIRDLQYSCSSETIRCLTLTAESLDNHTKQLEKQCARMMTTLKPIYTRAEIELPIPPVTKPLSDFPLELKRKTSMLDPSLEMSRLLILRARRAIKDTSNNQNNDNNNSNNNNSNNNDNNNYNINNNTIGSLSSGSCNEHINKINAVISNILEQLKDWCDEEGQIRLIRKTKAVRHRVLSIENFRFQLLHTLHFRLFSSMASSSSSSSSSGHLHLHPHISSADGAALAAVEEKCRFINHSNPIILECNGVIYNDRRGVLYVTGEYLYFHSPGGLFVSTEMKLIPLRLIVAVGVTVGSQSSILQFSIISLKKRGDEASSISKLISTQEQVLKSVDIKSILASTNGYDGICLIDEGGSGIAFKIVGGATADYCARIGDVINLLIQAKYYEVPMKNKNTESESESDKNLVEKIEKDDRSSNSNSNYNSIGNSNSNSNRKDVSSNFGNDAVLLKASVERESEQVLPPSYTMKTTTTTTVAAVAAAAAAATAATAATAAAKGLLTDKDKGENNLSNNTQGDGSGSGSGGVVTPEKKRLAHNIQAFLHKSQGKK